jgi:hypothetical protein
MAKRSRPRNQRPAKKTTAELIYSTGRGYLQFVIVGHNHQPTGTAYEMSFHLPKRMLLGFALELFLKSWLHEAGVTEADLRDIYGHDIDDLYQDAITNGLPQTSDFDRAVRELGPDHHEFGYRYMHNGSSYDPMDYVAIVQILQELDRVVDTFIGASASYGLTPGH